MNSSHFTGDDDRQAAEDIRAVLTTLGLIPRRLAIEQPEQGRIQRRGAVDPWIVGQSQAFAAIDNMFAGPLARGECGTASPTAKQKGC